MVAEEVALENKKLRSELAAIEAELAVLKGRIDGSVAPIRQGRADVA